eukprot:TRINITY_DN5233_c0_g1_i2.p1 TRINITY_DN5233_c0_g1~~TRINITY_DN5233_c0_g1_i2.p1  ORF type:complete len:498 (+),score=61.27 TRINITY_DN5233_c0_g1_i2:191-1495(+)
MANKAGSIKFVGVMSMLVSEASSAACDNLAPFSGGVAGVCFASGVSFPKSKYPSGSTVEDCCDSSCLTMQCPAGKGHRVRAPFLLTKKADPTQLLSDICCGPKTCASHTCSTGSLKPNAAVIEGDTDDKCCETRRGFCDGNTDPKERFPCPTGTIYKRGEDGSYLKGSDEATCCEATCDKHTCSFGWGLKPLAQTIGGNTDEKCCYKLSCCRVTCPAGKMRNTNPSLKIQRESEGPCCIDSTGMCSGNKDSSEDFTGCDSGYRLKAGSKDIKGSTKAECCEEDTVIKGMCTGNTNPNEKFPCPSGSVYKSNAASIKGNTKSACCEDTVITGKCTGNSNPSDDVKCYKNQVYKGLTCADYDCGTYCSSGSGTCTMKTTALANLGPNVAILSAGTNQAQWCSTCCEPIKTGNGDASGASAKAAVSATLAALLSFVI